MDFNVCAALFSANTTDGEALRAAYGWKNSVIGLNRNERTQISHDGCLQLCGSGVDVLPWGRISNTITTTGLLPVFSTLLQAPFESNAARRTFLAITRWVGSPIASLSHMVLNIRASAKAALMVDMAVTYDEMPASKSSFGAMRDSLYLLMAMNQYTLRRTAALGDKQAETLLRIVLFSKDLVLTDTEKSLPMIRRILAREVREVRRRGAVQVMFSTLIFAFAFALSIQATYSLQDEQTTSSDLALSCLLAWFPVLILSSIIDRNPIGVEAFRRKLNTLIDHVRHSLRNEEHRNHFIATFRDLPDYEELRSQLMAVAVISEDMGDLFDDFAGQGRIRWHHGIAHPILSDIEDYMADKGRNWLADERNALANLALGPVNDEGLAWVDIHFFWKAASAILIVGGCCAGGFVLSYFTPTVGLSCQSGGYLIFFSIAAALLVVELCVWFSMSSYSSTRHEVLPQTRRSFATLALKFKWLLIRYAIKVALLYPWKDKKRTRSELDNYVRTLSAQRQWEIFFFRPLETINTTWLVYIILAQTLGWYQTCDCLASTWGPGGGYIDFDYRYNASLKWSDNYGILGTVGTVSIVSLSMFYITVEWCQQSFMSTENYSDAMIGLRRTRRYKRWTYPVRLTWRTLFWLLEPGERLLFVLGFFKRLRKTLLWTRVHYWKPVEYAIPAEMSSQTANSAMTLIELSDFQQHGTNDSRPLQRSRSDPPESRNTQYSRRPQFTI